VSCRRTLVRRQSSLGYARRVSQVPQIEQYRVGRRVPPSLTVALIVLAGMAAAAALIVAASVVATDSSAQLLRNIGIAVGLMCLALAGGAWLRVRSLARERYLRAVRGNDLVFCLSRTDGLNAAIARLAGHDGVRLPIWSTAVVDDEGIEIWGGHPRQPHLLIQVRWSQIELIKEGDVRQAGTRQIGFLLNASGPTGTVVLPMQAAGAGLLAMYQLSDAGNRSLIADIENIRGKPDEPSLT